MPQPRRIENVNFNLPNVTLKIFPAPAELQRLGMIFDLYQYEDDVTEYNATLYSDDQTYRTDTMLMLIEVGQSFPDPDLAQFEVLKQLNSPSNLFLCRMGWADEQWKLDNTYTPPVGPEPEPEEPTDPEPEEPELPVTPPAPAWTPFTHNLGSFRVNADATIIQQDVLLQGWVTVTSPSTALRNAARAVLGLLPL